MRNKTKAWRKLPFVGTFRGVNSKRITNRLQPKMLPQPSVLMQQLMLSAGVWNHGPLVA